MRKLGQGTSLTGLLTGNTSQERYRMLNRTTTVRHRPDDDPWTQPLFDETPTPGLPLLSPEEAHAAMVDLALDQATHDPQLARFNRMAQEQFLAEVESCKPRQRISSRFRGDLAAITCRRSVPRTAPTSIDVYVAGRFNRIALHNDPAHGVPGFRAGIIHDAIASVELALQGLEDARCIRSNVEAEVKRAMDTQADAMMRGEPPPPFKRRWNMTLDQSRRFEDRARMRLSRAEARVASLCRRVAPPPPTIRAVPRRPACRQQSRQRSRSIRRAAELKSSGGDSGDPDPEPPATRRYLGCEVAP